MACSQSKLCTTLHSKASPQSLRLHINQSSGKQGIPSSDHLVPWPGDLVGPNTASFEDLFVEFGGQMLNWPRWHIRRVVHWMWPFWGSIMFHIWDHLENLPTVVNISKSLWSYMASANLPSIMVLSLKFQGRIHYHHSMDHGSPYTQQPDEA